MCISLCKENGLVDNSCHCGGGWTSRLQMCKKALVTTITETPNARSVPILISGISFSGDEHRRVRHAVFSSSKPFFPIHLPKSRFLQRYHETTSTAAPVQRFIYAAPSSNHPHLNRRLSVRKQGIPSSLTSPSILAQHPCLHDSY